ncbi:hypothetical protein Hypma_000655 [Hypsizygus marmoreus]|uniref:Uncharacterized protein n=1 Tax=Hypsizygus marmoreus TaxID=39966 RepID=A0A369J7V3_HYPMA|nr:hypothetical protein Hypma_000655 [Hypsizygus marmoreus]
MHEDGLEAFLPLPHDDVTPVPTFSATSATPEDQNGTSNLPLKTNRDSDPPVLDSSPNAFGIFQRYHSLPSSPDTPAHSTTSHTFSDLPEPSTSRMLNFDPYPNETSFLLGEWYWNGGVQKSQKEFMKLIAIISSDSFSPSDICQTNWKLINKKLAINDWDNGEWVDEDAGWHRESVSIQVPFNCRMKTPGPQTYTFGKFYHRSLKAVIVEKLESASSTRYFQNEPYELLWKKEKDGEPLRLYGEMYNSPAFIDSHRELQNMPREPGCDLPRCVVALMFWSDATHLTASGHTKLWPLYLGFGNDSKYERCKPTNNLFEHVAYFEKLPDEFKDFAKSFIGDGHQLSKGFLRFCREEWMHAQWKVLLDEDFMDAYKHGIVIQSLDGIKCRFYPRILTYSADYPEKVLMASVRQFGKYPCPRCKTPKAQLHESGTPDDRKRRLELARVDDERRRKAVSLAQRFIYDENQSIDSVFVERELFSESLTVASNAFSERLSEFLNLFNLFVVDLMHEIEAGTWKDTLVHLLRILASIDNNLLHELDKRFRAMPTFGRDTIRRFSSNASELAHLAARDFEDFLQAWGSMMNSVQI